MKAHKLTPYPGVLKSWNDWAIADILRQQAGQQLGIAQQRPSNNAEPP
jgi:hypothetical protein